MSSRLAARQGKTPYSHSALVATEVSVKTSRAAVIEAARILLG